MSKQRPLAENSSRANCTLSAVGIYARSLQIFRRLPSALSLVEVQFNRSSTTRFFDSRLWQSWASKSAETMVFSMGWYVEVAPCRLTLQILVPCCALITPHLLISRWRQRRRQVKRTVAFQGTRPPEARCNLSSMANMVLRPSLHVFRRFVIVTVKFRLFIAVESYLNVLTHS